MKVTIRLPTSLLRRFRELAMELSLDGRNAPLSMTTMLSVAVTERVASGINTPLEAPPATLRPLLSMEVPVADHIAVAVAHLAGRSGLSLEQAWHRVVLEFVERSEAPGLDVELEEAA